MYVNMYVCMYVYIYIYVHTSTYPFLCDCAPFSSMHENTSMHPSWSDPLPFQPVWPQMRETFLHGSVWLATSVNGHKPKSDVVAETPVVHAQNHIESPSLARLKPARLSFSAGQTVQQQSELCRWCGSWAADFGSEALMNGSTIQHSFRSAVGGWIQGDLPKVELFLVDLFWWIFPSMERLRGYECNLCNAPKNNWFPH